MSELIKWNTNLNLESWILLSKNFNYLRYDGICFWSNVPFYSLLGKDNNSSSKSKNWMKP